MQELPPPFAFRGRLPVSGMIREFVAGVVAGALGAAVVVAVLGLLLALVMLLLAALA